MLRESVRWVHVPPSGLLVEDAERLLVHPFTPRGSSRVWRSWPDRGCAEALILRTIEEARAAGGTRLVWHTGDGVAPPAMDEILPQYGFGKAEDLEVLALELGTNPQPRLPGLPVPDGVGTRLVRDGADLRLANVVEAGVFPTAAWDERDTRAYLQGLSKLEARGGRKPPAPGGDSIALRYLATFQGDGGEEVVATAGAEVAGATVRLWGAGTRAERRGRGAYRALVIERCRHAHALGATLALAKANAASSAPILRRAGFRLVATERRYALELAPRSDGRAQRPGHHLLPA
jgi:hypothetical protein